MEKPKQQYYLIKPLSIIQDKRLSAVEQDYLCLIASLQRAGGCVASNNYFASYFGVKRPRAVEVIGSLRKKGFIKSKEQKRGGKTVERSLWITDEVSKESLLMVSKKTLPRVSKESPAGLVRNPGFDSKESPYHILKYNNFNIKGGNFSLEEKNCPSPDVEKNKQEERRKAEEYCKDFHKPEYL